MTLHAEEEMDNEDLTIWDVECCILTGEIIECQKDRITSEWKYRIQGQAFDGLEIETIVKLSPTGKLVFITVYTV
jgi:hypothetical protein